MKLTAETPVTVMVNPSEDGGAFVEVRVPTYEGGVTFAISVERDADGDWVVHLPWPDDALQDKPVLLPGGVEVVNGIACMGSPDVVTPASWKPA